MDPVSPALVLAPADAGVPALRDDGGGDVRWPAGGTHGIGCHGGRV